MYIMVVVVCVCVEVGLGVGVRGVFGIVNGQNPLIFFSVLPALIHR